MRYSLIKTRKSGVFWAGLLLLGMAACDEAPSGAAGVTPAAPSGGASIEQDVERPDVFSVTEEALWDGRPSLGGVWVAYPGNIDPERVSITNTTNGKTVIGALFRRERENPGPAIQISSDTASALGVLAGAPTELSVVVLRRETIEITPPPAPEEEDPAEELGGIVEEVLADVPVAAPVVAVETPAVAAAPEAVAAEVEAPVVAETIAPVVTAAPPAKPFIQIATLSTEQNANDLVTILGNEGVLATIRTDDSGGRTLYRVISGPASSAAERDERLRIIKSLGFSDAFIYG